MGRSAAATGRKPSPLRKIFLLSSSTFLIMTNIRSRLRCGPKPAPFPPSGLLSCFPLCLIFPPTKQAKPAGLIPFHHHPFLRPWVFFPSIPVSLALPLSGLPECSGADHELCPWHVIPLASGAACAVHLRPHGIFTEHQWPHRLCHSGGDVGADKGRRRNPCSVESQRQE